MNISALRALIAEEIKRVLNEDAFRRIVITTGKSKEVQTEIEKFVARPEMKKDYPVKLKITKGVKPNTLVVDISGEGATVMGTKLGDQAKKIDKAAVVKTKTEIKRVPVSELAKTEETKIDSLIDSLRDKVKDSTLFGKIESFIDFQRTDPYTSYKEILAFLKIKFPKIFK